MLVLDTGLRTLKGAGEKVEHEELSHCKLHKPWFHDPNVGAKDDEDETTTTAGVLDFEAGHGTFIAGIVRQICPDAIVHSAGVLSSFGDGDVPTA